MCVCVSGEGGGRGGAHVKLLEGFVPDNIILLGSLTCKFMVFSHFEFSFDTCNYKVEIHQIYTKIGFSLKRGVGQCFPRHTVQTYRAPFCWIYHCLNSNCKLCSWCKP